MSTWNHVFRTRIASLVHHKPTGHACVRLNGRDFYCEEFGSAQSLARYQKLLVQHAAVMIPKLLKLPRNRMLLKGLSQRSTNTEPRYRT